jgi:hypothetical protein
MANIEGLRRKATDTRRGELTIAEQDDRYFRRDATSIPTVTNLYDIGSATFKLANIYATTFRGLATSANYADLAEMYRSDCLLEAGDVVILGGNEEITKCENLADNNVFGVISLAPGFLMNADKDSSEYYPVVMSGRSPCKVHGHVKKGDRLVAGAIPGHAMAISPKQIHDVSPYCIIGRSLEDKDTDGIGVVEAVLGKL